MNVLILKILVGVSENFILLINPHIIFTINSSSIKLNGRGSKSKNPISKF